MQFRENYYGYMPKKGGLLHLEYDLSKSSQYLDEWSLIYIPHMLSTGCINIV